MLPQPPTVAKEVVVVVVLRSVPILVPALLTIISSLPSPSISAKSTNLGVLVVPPVAKLTGVEKLALEKPAPLKRTINCTLLFAWRYVPTLTTSINPERAPTGTVTVSCVVVAAVTAPFAPLKKTALLAAVLLKLVPVIVKLLPDGPDVGENEPIVG